MNKLLLRLLACPRCKGKVVFLENTHLFCSTCKAYYAVTHGIPVMVDLDHLPEHLREQVRYFQKSTKTYDTPRAIEPWQNKYIERLWKYFLIRRGRVFVDNACGSGYMGIEAAKRGAYVLACDLNMSGLIRLLRQTKRLGLSHRFFAVCCTAEALPIRSLVADVVVSNAILEHLPKEKEAIEDIFRITKKNGLSMVTVPLAYHFLNPLFLLVNYYYDHQIGHLRRYTKEMLVKRFSGWKLVDFYYTGHTMKVVKTFINIIISLFDEKKIEKEDEKFVKRKIFASNISVIFRNK